MRAKNIGLSIILTIFLLFSLNVSMARSGPSQYYFDQWNDVYIEYADLGLYFGSEWWLIVKVDMDGVSDPGVGFSLYNLGSGALGLNILRSDDWYSHSWQGSWVGSPTSFVLSVSWLYMDIHQLTTSPQRISKVPDDNPTVTR